MLFESVNCVQFLINFDQNPANHVKEITETARNTGKLVAIKTGDILETKRFSFTNLLFPAMLKKKNLVLFWIHF